MKRFFRKLTSLVLSAALLCGSVPAVYAAGQSTYSDIQGHWAEEAITRWSEYNVVAGFGSEFQPDGVLTRAQMATILSNLLGLTRESTKNPFKDVANDAWYKTFILRCYEAGVMSGDGVNANPESLVTRQEAMTMLCNALGMAPMLNPDLSAFVDSGSIASWAAPYMAAMVQAGYVGGVGGGKLAPSGEMTRAASMTVLNNAIVQYINKAGTYTLSNEEGIILVASGGVTLTGETKADVLVTPAADGKTVNFDKATVTGGITVQADNAKIVTKDSTLPNIQFTGMGSEVEAEAGKKPSYVTGGSSGGGSGGSIVPSTLTISEDQKVIDFGTYQTVTITDAVGDGEVVLANVTITGDLIVRGGGSNSIKLDNCTIHGKVVMDKPEGRGEIPRLELTNTPVPKVEAKSPAIVEATDTRSGIAQMDAKAPVTIQGEKTQIEAVTAQADISVKGGKVDKIIVPAQANSNTPVQISVDEGAKLDQLDANAPTKIDAKGSVNEVTAKANVEVSEGAVNRVTVPENSTAVCVTVGENAVVSDVTVNASDVTIQNDGQVNGLSTELETPPEVKKEGKNKDKMPTDVCKHSWGGAWEYLDEDNHKKVCGKNSDHIRTEHHNWKGQVTTAPTNTQAGVMTYTCPVCKGEKTESIPALMTPAQQNIIRKAREAELLLYLDVTDLGGVTRLDMAKLMAAFCRLRVEKVPADQFRFNDCADLTDEERGVIDALCREGLMAGMAQGNFAPNTTFTRAEAVYLLFKALELPEMNVSSHFTDIPEGHWVYKAVNSLFELGIISGTQNGTFDPNSTANMQTALALLVSAKNWQTGRIYVEKVTDIFFEKDHALLRLNLKLPNNSNEIDRYRVFFWEENGQRWFSQGTCSGRMPIGNDLPSGHYTKIRIISVAKDHLTHQDNVAEIACDLTVTSQNGPELDKVTFTELGKNAAGEMGYFISAYRIGADTQEVVVTLEDGNGRDASVAGNHFRMDDGIRQVEIEFYSDKMRNYIPGGSYRVQEVLKLAVDQNNSHKAELSLITRGGWKKIELTGEDPAYQVSNIRFDGPHLKWDAPANVSVRLHYKIRLQDQNGTWFTAAGTDRTEVALMALPEGVYQGVKIETTVSDIRKAEAYAPLSLTVVQDSGKNTPDNILFNVNGSDSFTVDAYFVSPDTTCVFRVVEIDSNGGWKRANFQDEQSDRNGIVQFWFRGTENIDLLKNEHYLLSEETSRILSADRMSCEVHFAYLVGPDNPGKYTGMPLSYEVTNLRFSSDGSYLRWNAPDTTDNDNLDYRIYLKDTQGVWHNSAGTDRTEMALCALSAGNFQEIRVETYLNGSLKASVSVPLSLTVVQDTRKNPPQEIKFVSDGGDRFTVSAYQVSADTTCVFRLVEVDNTVGVVRGNFQYAKSDSNGRVEFQFGGTEAMELLQIGYFMLIEETYSNRSADGMSCEIAFTYLGDPVKCNINFPST